LLRGDPAELLHGSLLFDLVLSLHSDSLLFLGRKTNRRPIMAASLRVATFYDLPGIVQAIAQEIQAQVTPQEFVRLKSARSVIPAAREEFLLGRYNLWKNSDAALAIAIPHFERAIQLQPDYAAGAI
jgi:hypothetical protein